MRLPTVLWRHGQGHLEHGQEGPVRLPGGGLGEVVQGGQGLHHTDVDLRPRQATLRGGVAHTPMVEGRARRQLEARHQQRHGRQHEEVQVSVQVEEGRSHDDRPEPQGLRNQGAARHVHRFGQQQRRHIDSQGDPRRSEEAQHPDARGLPADPQRLGHGWLWEHRLLRVHRLVPQHANVHEEVQRLGRLQDVRCGQQRRHYHGRIERGV
mmetsp:Transcript_64268/g.184705  ORF Transcript_64268/g.184705 Transcript_64268/m.184705 type:complete len:209 (+) Transcript_64268:702-1328(+)